MPPNVFENEELYGSIILNGQKSPGKVTLSGHDRKVNWAIWSGPSTDGARMTLKNIPPIEFTASFYLVKDVAQGIDDYADWDKFLPVINSSVTGTTPKALPIYHPDLIENNIKSVVKAQIGGRVYDGKGGCTIAVKFQEYSTPKKKGGTPKPAAPVDPFAKEHAELNALIDQYQFTPNG